MLKRSLDFLMVSLILLRTIGIRIRNVVTAVRVALRARTDEKPFSSFCRSEPVLSEEFLSFTSFDGGKFCRERILSEEFLSFTSFVGRKSVGEQQNILRQFGLQQNFPRQMRRTTKYPRTVWAPTEFSPTKWLMKKRCTEPTLPCGANHPGDLAKICLLDTYKLRLQKELLVCTYAFPYPTYQGLVIIHICSCAKKFTCVVTLNL